ncbi:MAG: ParB/RepB/Spo0J family partition protein [Candidatus Bathyarchaeota archaeon]|nr:ParB/RepB/Spo0J family partition protein [Candidatus Bathyarchaeota archaeon]MDH5786815.1 ParB/RepB/Spo0J family partition protein [Candidatus Bathyarchaeota archaeon]
MSEVSTVNLELEQLETDVFSPRKTFSEGYVEELAESIEREGQLKPIIVRGHPTKPNVYQVIDGEHRIRALKKLGHGVVRAEVRRLSDEEACLLAMRVNQMHGKRLEELEEGLHIKKMMEQFGYTQTDVAERFRKTQAWVSYRLALAERLAPETREALITRVIETAHAREIAELPKEDQPAVVSKVASDKLSFKKTEALVHAIKDNPESKEEILAKPVEIVAPLPEDLQKFVEEHGAEQPKFSEWACEVCGAEYVVNWVWCEIRLKPREG